jgi:hypothetical protein
MNRPAATPDFSFEPEGRGALDEFQEVVGVSSRTEACAAPSLPTSPLVEPLEPLSLLSLVSHASILGTG